MYVIFIFKSQKLLYKGRREYNVFGLEMLPSIHILVEVKSQVLSPTLNTVL
uniref:Uncharacterized protein n=1 Tax=Arundo donax TaxID=35708 RepID=A0A0A9A8E3_ARUDO